MDNGLNYVPLALTFVIENTESRQNVLPNIINVTSSLFEISVIQNDVTETVYLPSSLVISGSRLGFTGIEIRSVAEIRVFGISSYNSQYLDGFLGLPIETLGCRYYVASYTESEVLIMASTDDTTVSIRAKVGISFENKYINADDYLNITIGRFQAAQFQSELDLSGSIITSSKPIAVMAGSKCVTVSANGTYCNHLVEQLPPTELWGSSFFLSSSYKTSDLFRIFSKENNTTVTITTSVSKTTVTIDEGEFHEIVLTNREYAWIESSNTIMTVQYRAKYISENILGGPAMCVRPSLASFDSRPVTVPMFYSSTVHDTNRFIEIVSPCNNIQHILLNGNVLLFYRDLDIQFIEKPYLFENYCKLFVPSTWSTVHITTRIGTRAQFSVIIYGYSDVISFSYLGKFIDLESRESTTIKAQTMTALSNFLVPSTYITRAPHTVSPNLQSTLAALSSTTSNSFTRFISRVSTKKRTVNPTVTFNTPNPTIQQQLYNDTVPANKDKLNKLCKKELFSLPCLFVYSMAITLAIAVIVICTCAVTYYCKCLSSQRGHVPPKSRKISNKLKHAWM
ncbi:uncharacterized protein [Antedon mediterranea]|uniref:uncharacterized protein n=1 Tax=Antedon mediterranea TaxID=105859 RepID=UPI003AF7F482